MARKIKQLLLIVIVAVAAAAAWGCGNTLFQLGDALGDVSDGIDQIEECVTPLSPSELNGVFALAAPVQWDGDTATLTDDPQPALAAFYGEQLKHDVIPAYYLNERIYALGPLAAGEVVALEPLSELVSYAWFYDAKLNGFGGQTQGFDGSPRTLRFVARTDNPAAYVRLNFYYPSQVGKQVARVTKSAQDGDGAPSGQTVVLNFGGRSGVTFRYGTVKPTNVGPLGDPRVREQAVRTFRETFGQFKLTVLTDEDDVPDGPFSIIHIGPADPALGYNGLAETIDYGNAILDDIAIVDTNSRVFAAARLLGADALGTAIGKVAAHEMGHLLGLAHVSAPDALMTGAGCQGVGLDPARLLARRFRAGPVTAFTPDFSMGFQDSEQYLLDVLGPAE